MVLITSFFTENFAPKTGLAPDITITRISDDTVVINAQPMTELINQPGYYYYDWTGFDTTEQYAIVADGGSSLQNVERYKYSGSQLLSFTAVIERAIGLVQENQYIDQTVFNGINLLSARLRIYSDAASVGTSSNVIATYQLTATYSAGEMQTYKVVKV